MCSQIRFLQRSDSHDTWFNKNYKILRKQETAPIRKHHRACPDLTRNTPQARVEKLSTKAKPYRCSGISENKPEKKGNYNNDSIPKCENLEMTPHNNCNLLRANRRWRRPVNTSSRLRRGHVRIDEWLQLCKSVTSSLLIMYGRLFQGSQGLGPKTIISGPTPALNPKNAPNKLSSSCLTTKPTQKQVIGNLCGQQPGLAAPNQNYKQYR